jgi:(p)ppGpp synthase/HD superfamily hydrolase
MTHTRWSQDEYIKAYKFAANAHRGQTVPGTELPYIMHVSFVSMEVIAALRTEQDGRDGNLAVQCALLHDVIEDTEVTHQQVLDEFGSNVAAGVFALSKDKSLAKDSQMTDSLRRISQQPPEIWMVKLADRITNLQPAPSYWTEDKIEKYRDEAIEILNTLGQASDVLSARLRKKIDTYGGREG